MKFALLSKYRMAVFYGLIFLGGCVGATIPTTKTVTVSWTRPRSGSPVAHYVLQDSIGTSQFKTVTLLADTSASVPVSFSYQHIFRVAGVDSQGRQGEWSENSDPATQLE
jgi:hypothetical protein